MATERVELSQHGPGVSSQNAHGDGQDLCAGGQSKHGQHIGLLDVIAAEANQLVQRRLGVAHAAMCAGAAGIVLEDGPQGSSWRQKRSDHCLRVRRTAAAPMPSNASVAGSGTRES